MIQIVDVCQESYSAKSPGRPIFNNMVSRIERGEAHGIIAWAPDRLARNSIDGGMIIYLLDQGIIKNLKFATYTFENNSQGKFMLQIMFGQSKYYSDALSENVRRGNRTKAEKGWRPNQAPLGYLNEPTTKTIVRDPVHFPLIRRMFELMLTGSCTPRQIAIIASDEWGFRTPRRKRIGGVPLAMSSVYHLLNNPFYCGVILWDGQEFPGRHEPVVTPDEFIRVQQMLKRVAPRRPQRHEFAFTGLIRCGSCGLGVTAEHKINRFGSRYTYYHCSRSALGPRCREPSIQLIDLERQIEAFLRSLVIPLSIEQWLLKELQISTLTSRDVEHARQRSLADTISKIGGQIDELTGLRLRGLMDDDEFIQRRSKLQQDRQNLENRLSIDNRTKEWFERFTEVILFSNRATNWFSAGDDRTKRAIFETVSSNPTLSSKILNIEAIKPFSLAAESATSPRLLGVLEDVLTQTPPETWERIRANIRMLRAQFEPEGLIQKPKRRSRAGRSY